MSNELPPELPTCNACKQPFKVGETYHNVTMPDGTFSFVHTTCMQGAPGPNADGVIPLRLVQSQELSGELAVETGGVPLPATHQAERAGRLRLQDADGKNLVSINLATGVVSVHDLRSLDAAAHLFWHAVHAAWRLVTEKKSFRDMVLQSGKWGPASSSGDLMIRGGHGSRFGYIESDGTARFYTGNGGPVNIIDVSDKELNS